MRKPCCDKEGINKGAWSKQEDKKLIDYIKTHGEGCWHSLPKAAGLDRCGKSCRLRWINYLRPDIKRGNFGQDEEDLIIKLHALLGNRWSLIAGRLPGRTDNEVKNYWNSRIRKKLIKMGIDPNNHRPNQNPNIGQAAQPLINPQTNNQRQPVSSAPPVPKSTGSANHACKTPLKFAHKDDRNGRPANSDAASCPEDENSAGSSDLNLELTIAFPSPDGVLKVVQEEIALQNESPMATEMKIIRDCEANSVPTLILF